MLRKFAVLLLSMVVLAGTSLVPANAGVVTNPNPGGTPGSWTQGDRPPVVDPAKPAILFVHGLNSSAKVWYEGNDMYQYAFDNGYETAFINLHDITGTSQNMWDNGRLLADKIKEISNHFGKKLVIVAHSKGGVDTQTALVHYNAHAYVTNVITLGTPHHGSQLADLAYSSWASWLAALIGSKSPGTESMQTSYMKYFRSQTDGLANVSKNKYYTFAGDNWGSGSTSHVIGGMYLSTFGANDGVVTVNNAYLPKGTMVSIGRWNHSTVRTGSHVFNLIKPYLTAPSVSTGISRMSAEDMGQVENTSADRSAEPVEVQAAAVHAGQTAQSEADNRYYIRGGEHNGTASEKLVVENGVASVNLNWISNYPVDQLHVVTPDGEELPVQAQVIADDGLLNGAYHHTVSLPSPEAGEWTVKADSSQPGAYLFMAAFEKANDQHAKLKKELNGKQLKVDTKGLKADKTKLKVQVEYYNNGTKQSAASIKQSYGKKGKKVQQSQIQASEAIVLPVTEGEGVYNVTVDVEGETTEGYPIRRTLIKSVYVDANGNAYSS
ncbi:esterase/lipase family protein [Paenibacillus tarimensis]|uniref:esterase/lipase family protein n=1 Tax=Paenibacillus tarimensis TaxID=416012 RepID=UPI001F29854A|nr:alpha/beta fold hydrolase [Paenibacillus tarimensis]MCF2944768.1 alpha/beta hydrolase [Paenibacillus tarimensis]